MNRLQERFARSWSLPDWSAARIVIACSGGPDSVALVRLLLATHADPRRLAVAHFDHQLRGAESAQDAEFVRQLCRVWELACHVGRAEPGQLALEVGGEGLESAARRRRYEFLVTTAEAVGARYVVTAHTADDQTETVLHHILRGTGLGGLSGIPRIRVASPAVTLVRPLLDVTRAEVEGYLAELGQAARHDPHNDCLDFLRNRIRHELLPLLADRYHPGVRESLRRLATAACEAQEVLERLAEELLDASLIRRDRQSAQLERTPLKAASEPLRREAMVGLWRRQGWPQQAMTRAHWQRLACAIAENADARFDLPGGIELRVDAALANVTRQDASDRVTSPEAGRGRSGPACADGAVEG